MSRPQSITNICFNQDDHLNNRSIANVYLELLI